MARGRKKNKHEREEEFKRLREEREMARRAQEAALRQEPAPGELDWDKEDSLPETAPEEKLLFDEGEPLEKQEETPPVATPAPSMESKPFTPPGPIDVPEPKSYPVKIPKAPEEPEIPPEIPPEVPPEMRPEEPDMEEQKIDDEEIYQKDLLTAEEKEQISSEVDRKLQESFKESDDWWRKWNEELEELMTL